MVLFGVIQTIKTGGISALIFYRSYHSSGPTSAFHLRVLSVVISFFDPFSPSDAFVLKLLLPSTRSGQTFIDTFVFV